MSVTLLQGDSLDLLKTLAEKSVQCVVTSPPYYGLRDYGTAQWAGGKADCKHNPQRPDGGERKDRVTPLGRGGMYQEVCGKCGAVRLDRQIGLESSPEAYVEKLVEVFREVRRVLKDDGTVWLNLGDSYAGSNNGSNDYRKNGSSLSKNDAKYKGQKPKMSSGLKSKDLIGIPWMVAFALRADGWWIRADIVWAKPNPMPESVRDRPTRSHEYIFLLSKSASYYYDHEAIKEPLSSASILRLQQPGFDAQTGGSKDYQNGVNKNRSARRALVNLKGRVMSPQVADNPQAFANLTGRNKRDVWTVTTKPYKEAHFATFPPDLIEPCILAGTSAQGECAQCGKAWVRVMEDKSIKAHDGTSKTKYDTGSAANRLSLLRQAARERGAEYTSAKTTLGWKPACTCQTETVAQIILDPFSGAGTTGLVARKHGRSFIGLELNPEYVALTWRRLGLAPGQASKE